MNNQYSPTMLMSDWCSPLYDMSVSYGVLTDKNHIDPSTSDYLK